MEKRFEHAAELAGIRFDLRIQVNALQVEGLELRQCLGNLRTESDGIATATVGDEIRYQSVYDGAVGVSQDLDAKQRNLRPPYDAEPDGVLDVSPDVADGIRQANDAALQRHGGQPKRGLSLLCLNLLLQRLKGLAGVRGPEGLVVHLTIVSQDAVQRLQAEIPSPPSPFDVFQKLDTLQVVVKMSDARTETQIGEKTFTVVAKGRMPDIMPQRDGFDKVLVEAQEAPHRSGDFGYQLNVKNTMGDVIVFHQIEDLGLVDVSGIGPGMKNSICIHGKGKSVIGSQQSFRSAPHRMRVAHGVAGERSFFRVFDFCPYPLQQGFVHDSPSSIIRSIMRW